MSAKVLVTGPRMLRDWARVEPMLERHALRVVRAEVVQCLSEDELIPLVRDIDAAICGGDKWTARVFDAAPRLRVLCKWGTGTDAIDLDAARARGIAVRNVPDAFSVPVADTVFAAMLCFARRTLELDRAMKRGEWRALDSTTLAECTLGVIGVGNIGSTVLRRARAFGMRTLGCDPRTPSLQVIDESGVRMVGLDELLRESDFVSVHCDLNATSRRLIDERALGLMKRSAVLINTSRGPVVHEAALVRALERGMLRGAALDVFEVEPLPANSPLRSMENVLLSPHLANSSDRAAWRVHERCVENLVELLASTAVRGSVNARAGGATGVREVAA